VVGILETESGDKKQEATLWQKVDS